MNLEKELHVAKELAIEAGRAIMEIYNQDFEVEWKTDLSPLTAADKKSNEIIVSRLLEAFPQYAVLSEETKDDKSRLANDWCWIIDPLDGTKEFIKRNGEFTVNIALAYKQKVVLGVIYVPAKGELYYAARGNGAYYQKDGSVKRLQVSQRRKNPRLVMSRSHASDRLRELIEKNNISEVKEAGSSLKGCMIAKGEAEIYYRLNPTMEWDTAAMHCIVEEAGGIFEQLDGTEMFYNRENSLNDKGFYILNTKENKLLYI
ncbi:3'(2'),5'-bisphosphate nucleotidase CysQ [Calderihabitans maritimus]|uniref:3'(2'),5'-bisphosphate nucleotidase CysQ n=1 Tax=Calderihabitans maritimus TaxID=1246530 RepID=A0A1Z5HXG8_9FIRM|nr:3'(2'),5'-bisphosphate nucleotidase CysQ [Calderihabitans maritimus]GAW94031.1 3'(2'),5'-bisphosphate nucleotidase CysQ [Calderihabitans maritimus]